MQPSVLYFIICVTPAPQTWTGCCSIGLMLTKRNFSSSQLNHYCRLASATGDIVGISEMSADVSHLYLLSLSERRSKRKNNTTSFLWRRRWNAASENLPAVMTFLRGPCLPKCCFCLGNDRHRPGWYKEMKRWKTVILILKKGIMSCFDLIRIAVISVAAAQSCVSILKYNKTKDQT